jgi:aspartyl-tRNA(Asn)/glutamyl-tRNA(Gln) amidotransferase subunit A
MPEQALAAARAAEDAVMNGAPLGAIHGIPFSVKDLIAVKGMGYASGSRTMADNVATVDAPSVERARAAGGILIGKTTTSEFGCKPVGDSPLTGITRNPWNLAKTPGGSSAGAAASVAAGITPFALGTDGGGSIRIPAAFTGLVGLKGQFGRVPVSPTSATPTLAHVGPLARSVADMALLFSVIAGFDRRDAFGVAGPVPDVTAAVSVSVAGMRVAYSPTFGYARPDPEVVKITDRAAQTFEQLGCHVDLVENVFDVDPPIFGWRSSTPVSAFGFVPSSNISASLWIRLWPMSLNPRCRRKCATTTPRFLPDTRCENTFAFSSIGTTF